MNGRWITTQIPEVECIIHELTQTYSEQIGLTAYKEYIHVNGRRYRAWVDLDMDPPSMGWQKLEESK